MTAFTSPSAANRRSLPRAAAWLGFLAPFFYLTYGTANWLASIRADVPAAAFDWERSIPFLAWTIIPYWSVNAFYGLSFFVCSDRRELDAHGRRLLTAQVIAVLCFVLFPLRFSFDRPDPGGGLPGFLFTALSGFDKPFNQAPSLHIALLIILWPLYARHFSAGFRPVLHGWFALIGASVLTTYQHHFIDIPTGALLGLLCLWLWPDAHPNPLAAASWTMDPKRRRLALRYGIGATLLTSLGFFGGGPALVLLWPAVSLALVAANYAFIGPAGFQKAPDGRTSLAAKLLLAPHLLAAYGNSRAWTFRDPAPAEVSDGVFLGRLPAPGELRSSEIAAVVDLCAELPNAPGVPVTAIPLLDLVTPAPADLAAAADAIEGTRHRGPVLVCCALGYSRSAAAVATWLLRSGRAGSVEEAVAAITRVRAGIVLDEAARAAVASAARLPASVT